MVGRPWVQTQHGRVVHSGRRGHSRARSQRTQRAAVVRGLTVGARQVRVLRTRALWRVMTHRQRRVRRRWRVRSPQSRSQWLSRLRLRRLLPRLATWWRLCGHSCSPRAPLHLADWVWATARCASYCASGTHAEAGMHVQTAGSLCEHACLRGVLCPQAPLTSMLSATTDMNATQKGERVRAYVHTNAAHLPCYLASVA